MIFLSTDVEVHTSLMANHGTKALYLFIVKECMELDKVKETSDCCINSYLPDKF
jgi:hypothetical protein